MTTTISPEPSSGVPLIVLMVVPLTNVSCTPVTTPVRPLTDVTGPPDMDAALAAAASALASAAMALAAAAVSLSAALLSLVAALLAAVTAAARSVSAIVVLGLPDASKLRTFRARLAALGSPEVGLTDTTEVSRDGLGAYYDLTNYEQSFYDTPRYGVNRVRLDGVGTDLSVSVVNRAA